MNDYREQARSVIRKVVDFLETSPWKNVFLNDVKEMLYAIDRDGTVAIAGRVKAGKSSLLNALLNDDLALVGTTETTATINVFLHTEKLPEKRPPSEETPILCKKKDQGKSYWISRKELDEFQGNDEVALEKSLDIEHFEYYLANDFLRQITLVDTPGTGALVDEHRDVTARYLRLEQELRDRHDKETLAISETADAVIYLVGPVAQVNDQKLLNEFTNAMAGRTRAYNTIGVMSKIDLDETIINDRVMLAKRTADKMTDQLNTVVPVSAGIARALHRLNHENRLAALQEQLRKIDGKRLAYLLRNVDLWHSSECVLSSEERKSLSQGMPWSVFAVIAKRLYALPLDEAVRELEDISGFATLRKVIKDHFVARKHLLRCHQVVNDLAKIVRMLSRQKLAQYKDNAAKSQRDFKSYCDFIASHPHRNSEVCDKLRRFLSDHKEKDDSVRLQNELEKLQDEIEFVQANLDHFHAHFSAIQKIESNPEAFSDEEKKELRNLFGMYADSDEPFMQKFVTDRQLFWKGESYHSFGERKDVAEIAVKSYGKVLHQLLTESKRNSEN